ncbi:MAG TPA: hypothetical protein VGK67_30735 [Myxococcales bacterium]|jgi:hypothetical protein
MDKLISLAWAALLGAVVVLMAVPELRAGFEAATRAHPYLLGLVKIGVLGTMGELLGKRIVRGTWTLRGIRLEQRFVVWAFLGIAFAAVFPLFSFGVDGLLKAGLLPGEGRALAAAFWKSFFMNLIFAPVMMVFHRLTDTLIERGQLLQRWPVTEAFVSIDWKTMFRVPLLACVWFWIPAHTVTFMLPPEYRVLSAALLAIALGFIMGFANRRKASDAPPANVPPAVA